MKLTPDRLEQVLAAVRPELGADVAVRVVDQGGGRFTIEVTVGGYRLIPLNTSHYEEHELEEGLRRVIASRVAEYRKERPPRPEGNGERDLR